MITFSIEENYFFYSKSSRYGGSLHFKIGVVAPLDKETGMVGDLLFLEKVCQEFKTYVLDRGDLPFDIKLLIRELSNFLNQHGLNEDSQYLKIVDPVQKISVEKKSNQIYLYQYFDLFASEPISETYQFTNLVVQVPSFLIQSVALDLAPFFSKGVVEEKEITQKIQSQLHLLREDMDPLGNEFFWRFENAKGQFLEKSF